MMAAPKEALSSLGEVVTRWPEGRPLTLALLFPGQGTQHAAALPWLDDSPEAQSTLARTTEAVGMPWRECLADVERCTANAVAQPLLTGLCLAAWQCLAARLPAPAVVAGYSVGELAAACSADVFDEPTALALVIERAAAMDRSSAGARTGLLAVSDVDLATLRPWSERHGLALAIRLSPESAIYGGPESGLDTGEAELQAAGTRCKRLPVRVASHTPWMAAAAQDFGRRLAATSFAEPRCAVVCDLDATATRNAARLREALAGQIASPVLWDACMDAIAERRVRCVLEVGPGTTLSSLWRARHPQVPARSVDEFRSVDGIAAWVQRVLREPGG